MSDVLLTGYGPFGEFERNPALRLAMRLDGTEVGAGSIVGRELPVAFDRAAPQLEAAVEEHDPAIVCALGLAGGRNALTVERVGINLRDTDGVPDNADREVIDESIAPDGPDAYFATLPVREMKDAMRDAGVPTRLSTDAGTHLVTTCCTRHGTSPRRRPATSGRGSSTSRSRTGKQPHGTRASRVWRSRRWKPGSSQASRRHSVPWTIRTPVPTRTPGSDQVPRLNNFRYRVGHTILLSGEAVRSPMADKSTSGEVLGVPYNFERPSIGRMLSSYWRPGEGMLVEKPFGVGYTLNLANWRSWVVVLVAGALLWQQEQGASESTDDTDDEPVEVIVDDESGD